MYINWIHPLTISRHLHFAFFADDYDDESGGSDMDDVGGDADYEDE